MAECMNRRTRRARAACARVTAPLPCSRPRGCREKPAPLEIMSRAVRIAARRLSACLTAVPKSVPNPSAPHGSGAAKYMYYDNLHPINIQIMQPRPMPNPAKHGKNIPSRYN